MRLTLVTGMFSADHTKPYGDHRHGHDWHVEAIIPESGDKASPEERLDEALRVLHGAYIDSILSDPSNEGVAQWLGERLSAAQVLVYRFDRGRKFGALWLPDA